MRYLTAPRQKKTFKISHITPGDIRLGFILMPVGYSYNSDIAAAKKGDILRFADGKTHEILYVRRLRTDKPDADILCRIRYGITLKGAMMRWRANAKLEGHGSNAVSSDECLWIIYSLEENE